MHSNKCDDEERIWLQTLMTIQQWSLNVETCDAHQVYCALILWFLEHLAAHRHTHTHTDGGGSWKCNQTPAILCLPIPLQLSRNFTHGNWLSQSIFDIQQWRNSSHRNKSDAIFNYSEWKLLNRFLIQWITTIIFNHTYKFSNGINPLCRSSSWTHRFSGFSNQNSVFKINFNDIPMPALIVFTSDTVSTRFFFSPSLFSSFFVFLFERTLLLAPEFQQK